MKQTICIVVFLIAILAVCAQAYDSIFTNSTMLVWDAEADANDGLGTINTNMGLPKWDAYIEGVLATNIPMTTNYSAVLECLDWSSNTVYALPECDEVYYTNAPVQPRKEKLMERGN